MHVEERWGESVIKQLSEDLRISINEAKGLTPSNLYYCKRFYILYNQLFEKVPQVGEIIHHRLGSEPHNGDAQIIPQLVEIFKPLHTIAEKDLLPLNIYATLGVATYQLQEVVDRTVAELEAMRQHISTDCENNHKTE